MYEENEISIKELILILINEKKMIAIITSIFTVGAIVVTLLLPKVYETQSQIIYNLPTNYESKYGTYVLPSQNISDYIPLLNSDEVKNEIAHKLNIKPSRIKPQISFDKENKYVIVKTSGSTPELAKQINDLYVQTYIKRIRTHYKINAIETFINSYQLNVTNTTFAIERNKSMLLEKQTFLMEINPVYTLQKAIFADAETAALYADKFNLDLSTLSNGVVLEEYVNEKYLELEAEVIDLRSLLINLSENLKFNEILLNELNKEKEIILKEFESLNYDLILDDELDILNGSIIQVSDAVIPNEKTSPRGSVNVVIGFVFGLLISLASALFKHFWMKDSIVA